MVTASSEYRILKSWGPVSCISESTTSCKYSISCQMIEDVKQEIWGIFIPYSMNFIHCR